MIELVRAGWIGRPRAGALVTLALLAVVDLVSFVSLVVGDDPAAAPGPDEVARTVIQAVADDDCADLGDLLADDRELPPSVRACLRGTPSPVELDDVRVVATSVTGSEASVSVAVSADGTASEVVVDLAREGDRWLVVGVRPSS